MNLGENTSVKGFELNNEVYMAVNGKLYILKDSKWIKVNNYKEYIINDNY